MSAASKAKWRKANRERENANRRARYAQRGPSDRPRIPAGHELAGLSTLRDERTGEPLKAWEKTRVAGAEKPPTAIPETHLTKSTATMRRGDGTTVVQWVSTAADEKAREDAMRAAWERHAEVYRGLAGTAPEPEHTNADTITLYPLGDPHVGMLAWGPEAGVSHDLAIATRELLACVRELVASAPASERAIVTNLGDFLHAQDDSALTPGHGNKLDVDGRFAKVLDAGHAILRGIVDTALTKHRHVTVRNLPGNHDPRVAAELCFWLKAVYEKEPRVTVADAFAAHQYDRFGLNLFGWAHGDRSPGKELPAIMAVDRPADWGETKFRVWNTGHVHHESCKEYPGCDVESHGILPPGDAWHAGRYRSRRRMSAITHHRDFGEVSRVTVGIERVHAALRRNGTP